MRQGIKKILEIAVLGLNYLHVLCEKKEEHGVKNFILAKFFGLCIIVMSYDKDR
jgi:hypothetical protein